MREGGYIQIYVLYIHVTCIEIYIYIYVNIYLFFKTISCKLLTPSANYLVFQMEHHLPGGLGGPMKGTLTGEVPRLGFSSVNVAWMRVAWTFDTSAIVMLTKMNGNGDHDLSAVVGEAH